MSGSFKNFPALFVYHSFGCFTEGLDGGYQKSLIKILALYRKFLKYSYTQKIGCNYLKS